LAIDAAQIVKKTLPTRRRVAHRRRDLLFRPGETLPMGKGFRNFGKVTGGNGLYQIDHITEPNMRQLRILYKRGQGGQFRPLDEFVHSNLYGRRDIYEAADLMRDHRKSKASRSAWVTSYSTS
jgi:hypothetical protein